MFELPHDKVNNGSDYKSMACTRDLEYKRIYLKAKLVILDKNSSSPAKQYQAWRQNLPRLAISILRLQVGEERQRKV